MEGARARGAQPRLGRAPSAGGAGRGAGARQVRGARGREVGPSRGSGLQPPPWSGRPQQLPRSGVGAVRISRPPPEPCTWCTAESPPAGVRPPPRPGQGPFLLSGQRLVPVLGLLPPRTSGRNPKADWKDAGGRQGMRGAGGAGEGRGPLCFQPGRRVFSRPLNPARPPSGLFTGRQRPRKGQRYAPGMPRQVRGARVSAPQPSASRWRSQSSQLPAWCLSTRLPPHWDGWTEEGREVGGRSAPSL